MNIKCDIFVAPRSSSCMFLNFGSRTADPNGRLLESRLGDCRACPSCARMCTHVARFISLRRSRYCAHSLPLSLDVQSIPIQRLQGFRPSVGFFACKSKISLCTQLKTRRDRNLVNVEWELTVHGAATYLSQDFDMFLCPSSKSLQGRR